MGFLCVAPTHFIDSARTCGLCATPAVAEPPVAPGWGWTDFWNLVGNILLGALLIALAAWAWSAA